MFPSRNEFRSLGQGHARRSRQSFKNARQRTEIPAAEKLQFAALHRSSHFAKTGFITLFGSGFTGRGNILGTRPLQNFLSLFCPLRIVGMHGEQYSAILNAALVTLSFVLRDSQSNQGTCET